MKITSFVREAVTDEGQETGSAFIRLLSFYGVWARYFGAVGYLSPGGCNRETVLIDDDSAMIVDRAMQRLKDTAPAQFKFLTMYYVRGLDEGDILSICKGKPPKRVKAVKHWHGFAATPEDLKAAKHLTQKGLREILAEGEKKVFCFLSEFVRDNT